MPATQLISIICILGGLILFTFGGYKIGQQSVMQMSPMDKELASSQNSPTNLSPVPTTAQPVEKRVEVIASKQECVNNILHINLGLTEGWSCRSVADNQNSAWIELSDGFFEITISNGARDTYCNEDWPPPEDEDECTTITFLSNEKVVLEMWTLNGENKEIFGFIKTQDGNEEYLLPSGTSISINYQDMETKELTETQMSELSAILNNIEIRK